LYNIGAYPEYHIKSKTFIAGYESQTEFTEDQPRIFTKPGDIRVDLPVWFGCSSAAKKVVIVGMEPRDTDKKFGLLNIERVGKYVFATPFALERTKGPYHSAFQSVFNSEQPFVYFTDVVKTFQVSDGGKSADDKNARHLFQEKAQAEQHFLLEELGFIEPDMVIALGNDAYAFLQQFLGAKYTIQKVRHPSQGGALAARNQLTDLLGLISHV
jgi:hypothetical protein